MFSSYIKRCSDVQWLHQKMFRCSVVTSKDVQMFSSYIKRCSVVTSKDVQWLNLKMFTGCIWKCSYVQWLHVKIFSCSVVSYFLKMFRWSVTWRSWLYGDLVYMQVASTNNTVECLWHASYVHQWLSKVKAYPKFNFNMTPMFTLQKHSMFHVDIFHKTCPLHVSHHLNHMHDNDQNFKL